MSIDSIHAHCPYGQAHIIRGQNWSYAQLDHLFFGPEYNPHIICIWTGQAYGRPVQLTALLRY